MIGSRLKLFRFIKKTKLNKRCKRAILKANEFQENTKRRYLVMRFGSDFEIISVQDIKTNKKNGNAVGKFKSYPINKIIESAVYDTNNKNIK